MLSYTFSVNNTRAHIKLIAWCVLLFIALLILFLAGLWAKFIVGDATMIISLSLLILGPVALFYTKRKIAREEVTAILDEASVEIRWPNKSIKILFSEIELYFAYHVEGDESDDEEIVGIRLKDGRKIRLKASDGLGEIKSLGKFRMDFEKLAKKLNLKEKYFFVIMVLATLV